MKHTIQILTMISIGLFLNSCYYDTFPEEEVIPPPEDISYQADIMPLWSPGCVGCHSGNTPPDLRDEYSYESILDGYVIPGDADASILYKSLIEAEGVSPMPFSGLGKESKNALVKEWINQGAKR